MRWADRVAPADLNSGAADAPWLADLPVMRAAISAAVAEPATRDLGYGLANRVFSSLYTAMRAREAVEILEEVLVSGDGPAAIGAQVARRAGIAASEVRGTYEGMWLLERSDEHAATAPGPRARARAQRLDPRRDAPRRRGAGAGRGRGPARDRARPRPVSSRRAALRTLVDVQVSRGDFAEAGESAQRIHSMPSASVESFIPLSVRTLMARIALEQGRSVEAASAARAAVRDAEQQSPRTGWRCWPRSCSARSSPTPPRPTSTARALPWAVRLPVLAQDARDHFLRRRHRPGRRPRRRRGGARRQLPAWVATPSTDG